VTGNESEWRTGRWRLTLSPDLVYHAYCKMIRSGWVTRRTLPLDEKGSLVSQAAELPSNSKSNGASSDH
jgi:hypothetical protein